MLDTIHPPMLDEIPGIKCALDLNKEKRKETRRTNTIPCSSYKNQYPTPYASPPTK